ncbi:MAG: hypothetical protein ACPIOQ_23200 [Promethearchaeia archaeon]
MGPYGLPLVIEPHRACSPSECIGGEGASTGCAGRDEQRASPHCAYGFEVYVFREGGTEEAAKGTPPKGWVAGMRTSVLVLCAAAPAAAAAFTPVALPCVARRSSASAITTMVCVCMSVLPVCFFQ